MQLYSLVGLRARVRAAEDALTLTADQMRRLLHLMEGVLVRGKPALANGNQLAALMGYSAKVLSFYQNQVLDSRNRLREAYERQLELAGPLALLAGGRSELLARIDALLDSEALDVHLNEEASSLEFPPTINEPMLKQLERKWIPSKLLDSLELDRRQLLAQRQRLRPLLLGAKQRDEQELAELASYLSLYICSRAN